MGNEAAYAGMGPAQAGNAGKDAAQTEAEAGRAGCEAAGLCRLAGKGDLWVRLRGRMSQMLGQKRLNHSFAVADESVALGRVFGGDLAALALAGLLHDGAKELGNEKLLSIGESAGLITDPAERENPFLLHGPVAAWLAYHEWGIRDPVILESIRLHTTGAGEMSKEACIVFMADLIEPGRAYAGVDTLRQLCMEDLRTAMIEAIEQTFLYLERTEKPLHQGTSRCLAWLKKERSIEWKARS